MIAAATLTRAEPHTYIKYSPEIEIEITQLLGAIVAASHKLAATYNPRWLAIQLLEGDEAFLAEVGATEGGPVIEQAREAMNGSTS